jgi:plastocyanin
MTASSRALLLAGMLPLCMAAVVPAGAPAARIHKVAIRHMRFEPAALVVRQGDTVEWINEDLVPHTATSKESALDSSTIAAGRSWQWTARTGGRTTYVCTFHPTMSGRIDVE